MRQWMTALGLAIALFGAPGCATLMSGGPAKLQVEVEAPEGPVQTTVRGLDNGNTETRTERRFTVVLERTSDYVVVSSGDGLAQRVKVVRSELNNWVWGNLAIVGAGYVMSVASPYRTIDAQTGQILSSTPNFSYLGSFSAVAVVSALIDLLSKNAWAPHRKALEIVLDPLPEAGREAP